MKWPKGPYTVKQGIRGYRFTVVDREGSAIADVPEVLLVEHDARAVANLLCAAPDLVEAIEVAHACGEPHKKSLYDEEGVEGWRWQHPDGREWSVMGDWREDPPMHPMLEDALAKARGEN